RHFFERDAEAVREILDRQVVIAVFRRRVQKSFGVRRFIARLRLMAVPYEIIAAQQLGHDHLRSLEVDALNRYNDVEDGVPFRDARTEGAGFLLVPAPAGVLVCVRRVRTADMRFAILPGDVEATENVRLAAFDRSLDRASEDLPRGHRA